MAGMQPHWDIFCRVIDNYGDIGVCWRLARQLASEHGIAVRLWVDDPATLVPLCGGRIGEGVEVKHWRHPFPTVDAADVVVEAFACDLPANYLQAMASRRPAPRWVNLEYLSAEPWVEGCHGLASPHPSLPLVKHFFFPGFTSRTGGLLREAGLLQARKAFARNASPGETLEVSLFCYDTAPVGELLDAWSAGQTYVRCHVAPGKPLAAVKRHFSGEGPWQRGNLEVVPVPFVPQAEFDHLLWRCDINFVRGEDSFVRAQWAAKPFVWHIYPQQDEAHLAKLEAFLDLYTAGLAAAAALAIRDIFKAWTSGQGLAAAWATYIAQRSLLDEHGRQWAQALEKQDDLAANLVKFCSGRV